MDAQIAIAMAAAVGAVGSGVGGITATHILGRRLRAAQITQAKAQTKQIEAQAALIGQDIYQQITADLRDELARVKADLESTRESLRLTSTEEERLRARVLELESRVVELSHVREERDRLRIDLAAREATITELQRQVADLKVQLAVATGTVRDPAGTAPNH